jgi:hypothetical protein
VTPVGEWLVLAERVLHDSQTDMLSLINCLEVVPASSFPAAHVGFAMVARYRLDEAPPTEDVPVTYRLVRVSSVDGEEQVAQFEVPWAANTTHTRLATRFAALRLLRAERLTFRVDHRVGDAAWIEGPSSALDVVTTASPGD